MVQKMSAKKYLDNSMCKTEIWESQFSEDYCQLLIGQTYYLLTEKKRHTAVISLAALSLSVDEAFTNMLRKEECSFNILYFF